MRVRLCTPSRYWISLRTVLQLATPTLNNQHFMHQLSSDPRSYKPHFVQIMRYEPLGQMAHGVCSTFLLHHCCYLIFLILGFICQNSFSHFFPCVSCFHINCVIDFCCFPCKTLWAAIPVISLYLFLLLFLLLYCAYFSYYDTTFMRLRYISSVIR